MSALLTLLLSFTAIAIVAAFFGPILVPILVDAVTVVNFLGNL